MTEAFLVSGTSAYGAYGIVGEDEQGKYAELRSYQSYEVSNPGSMQLNGIWYADEAGPGDQYRIRATVETSSDFSIYGEPGIFVFGYRYGYLDEDRRTYSLWGYRKRPGPTRP